MPYEGLHYLPHKISCPENAEEEFRLAFSSKESDEHKGIVYFFLSEKPIPRVLGESRILYIGKTNTSLRTRYYDEQRGHRTKGTDLFTVHMAGTPLMEDGALTSVKGHKGHIEL